jgi:hypothetical protein
MAINSLTETEKDYQYSQGFLERWVELGQTSKPPLPKQIGEHLKVLADGLKAYREKYVAIQEDFDRLNDLYSRLVGLSAQYLETIRFQKEQIDQTLIEQQREFHTRQTPLIET